MGNFDNISCDKNSYFDVGNKAYDKDKNLLSLMINEYYNKYGVCMEYYITSYDKEYDKIFGEDNDRKHLRNFSFNGYFTLPREDKLWNKFGITSSDQLTIWISKRHFEAASLDPNTKISYIRPQIGDHLKSEYSNYFYEITEVAEDTGQFLQSSQYVWEITALPMKDEYISLSESLSASDIVKVMNLDDLFNVKNIVDDEKEEVIYEPKKGELPKDDPFGNW